MSSSVARILERFAPALPDPPRWWEQPIPDPPFGVDRAEAAVASLGEYAARCREETYHAMREGRRRRQERQLNPTTPRELAADAVRLLEGRELPDPYRTHLGRDAGLRVRACVRAVEVCAALRRAGRFVVRDRCEWSDDARRWLWEGR